MIAVAKTQDDFLNILTEGYYEALGREEALKRALRSIERKASEGIASDSQEHEIFAAIKKIVEEAFL